MTKDLPWEVQLLLMLDDADPEVYGACLDCLTEQVEDGDMPPAEIRRFVDAMRHVTVERQRQFLTLTNFVEGKSKVTFENGRWQINE
jgi:hypothetical protein